jgi:DNA-binding HxlR family transcriptional regulator
MLGRDYRDQDCLIARALEVVGERWTLLVLRDAVWGVRRFTDFQEHLDIPRAILSGRLKGLVASGLMRREPDPDRPGRDLYELTDAGRALWPVLHGLSAWAADHLAEEEPQRQFSHASCGRPLDRSGRCACGATPPPGEVVMSLRDGARPRRRDRVSVALAERHRLLTPLDIEGRSPASTPPPALGG